LSCFVWGRFPGGRKKGLREQDGGAKENRVSEKEELEDLILTVGSGREEGVKEARGLDEFLFKDLKSLSDKDMKVLLSSTPVSVVARSLHGESDEMRRIFLEALEEDARHRVRHLLQMMEFDAFQTKWARANVMQRALELFCFGKLPWGEDFVAAVD